MALIRFDGKIAAAILAGAGVASLTGPSIAAEPRFDVPPEDYRIQHGRIKQAVHGWCFAAMPAEQLIRACHRMGIPAMDVGKEHYPLLRELGTKAPMVGGHGFKMGPLSRKNRKFCVEKLRSGIDLAAQWGHANNS